MAWKLENMRKDPNSKESYADLFISQIKEEPKTACLFTIGDARTVEIILEKYKNTQFIVFDYPALIKFLDFAKPANLFKAIPIKYDWESEAEFLEFVEAEMQKASKEIEGTNMSFDLIIANPPYGKSSSLSKKIVNTLLENKVAKEMIVLAPRNIYKDSKILAHVATYQDVENCFTDATIDRLAITRLVPGTVNKYTYESISLNRKQVELLSAIRKYNSCHGAHFHVVDGNNFSKKWDLQLKDTNSQIQLSGNLEGIADEKLADLVENFQCFFKTIWTPFDGVHISDSHDIRYNLDNIFNEKVKEGWFKSHCGDLFIFKDKVSRENFNKWWYSCRELYGKERKGLTNYILGMLYEAVSGSAGVNSFYDFLPHVDWSHPWTDQEILKELGLPEDFLGE